MKDFVTINGVNVYKSSKQWEHAEMRIKNAEAKSKGDNKTFVKQMVTRLKKIQNMEKVYYAIAVLEDRNHGDVVNIYNGKLVLEKFLNME